MMYKVYKVKGRVGIYLVYLPTRQRVRVLDMSGNCRDAGMHRLQLNFFIPAKVLGNLPRESDIFIDSFPNLEETRAFLTMLTIMEE